MFQTMRSFKYAEPFEPFGIELSSGRVLHVATPDHIALTEAAGGRIAVLSDDGGSLIVPLLHVTGARRFPKAER